MTLPNYPNNPTVGDTYEVSGVTFQWDGEKWKSISGASTYENRIQALEPFETVQAMKAGSPALGSLVQTKGYYSAGDGGGATYLIESGSDADGYGDHNLDSGSLKAVLQPVNSKVSLDSFGFKADGSDNSLQMVSFVQYCTNFGVTGALKNKYYNLAPDVVVITNGDILRLEGSGRFKCGLRPTSAGTKLISLSDNGTLVLEGMDLDCSSEDCSAIIGESITSTAIGVQATQCRISVAGSSTKDAVKLVGTLQNVVFDNCLFQGNPNPSLTGNLFELQSLLKIPDDGTPSGDANPVVVNSCRFTHGVTQFATFGTDSAISPIHLTNNTFLNAACRAIHLYHGEEAICTGNIVDGVKGERPTVDLNNIGGAVWLDLYSPLVSGSRNGAVYSDNIIRNCKGVGVFVEEYIGHLAGWHIMDTDVFPNSYTFQGSDGFSTSGGYGVVVAGGCKRLSLGVRADGNITGVIVDKTLGVDPSLQVGVISLTESNIDENKEHGVLLRNQIRQFRMLGGSCVGNGTSLSNTYDGIHIDRDSTGSLTELHVKDVSFDDQSTSILSRHCIGKTYPALYLDVDGCRLNSLGNWIDTGGTATGQIRNNNCIMSRGFNISGSDQWYFNNTGFITEVRDKVTVANGFLEYNYTMDTSGSRAFVSPVNIASFVSVSLNLLSTKLQIRLYDEAGTLLTSDVDVAIQISSSKSIN